MPIDSKEVRTLSQSLTLRYDKVLFVLDPTEISRPLAGQKVVVCDYPDGRLEIMHQSFSLPYRAFDTLRSVHRCLLRSFPKTRHAVWVRTD